MSGGSARTDLAYSTHIARALGLRPGHAAGPGVDYLYPDWPHHGFPVNAETLLRALYDKLGNDITGLEWVRLFGILAQVIHDSNVYYRKGEGSLERPCEGGAPFFHNVSVRDFQVADAWLVTPSLCRDLVLEHETQPPLKSLSFLPVLARTGHRVLNPGLDSDLSQIGLLERHAGSEGVENLLLWLGGNNCFRAMLQLKVKETPGDPLRRPHRLSFRERHAAGWNLWHPDDFAAEYRALLDRVSPILESNRARDWKVFAAAVPPLSVLPFLKGYGTTLEIPGEGRYHARYTYFPLSPESVEGTGLYLSLEEVLRVDRRIRSYNQCLRTLLEERNRAAGRERFFFVDIWTLLKNLQGLGYGTKADTVLPAPLAAFKPPLTTDYYHADSTGRFVRGGIFSLDGIHPSATGQALIAAEFLKVMKKAGVGVQDGPDWRAVLKSDSLFTHPIPLMHEIYRIDPLARHLLRLMSR